MKKIGIVGHFAVGKDFFEGQTIKIRALYSALQKVYVDDISTVDTFGGVKIIPKLIIKTFSLFTSCKNVVMLPAQNGLKIFTPLFSFCNLLFGRKLHYIVIGGWLPEYVIAYRFIGKLLKKFDCIHVETSTMKKALESLGYTNVSILPNFKNIRILSENDLPKEYAQPYRFCTFSRVMKEKGIEDAIDAVTRINKEKSSVFCTLDIYGKIDDGYKDAFLALQKSFPEYIRYCGCVDADKSVDILKDYYALLFPTHFKTEGIPGTVVDALSSGVITLARRWNSADDVVLHNQTGIIYPSSEIKDLYSAILWSIENSEKTISMKKECLSFAQSFSEENAIKILCDKLS